MVHAPAFDIPPQARQVVAGPHWRFLVRPTVFSEHRIPSLLECWRLVETCQVRADLREYPDIDRSPSQSARGQDWIGSWQDWSFWRLYQSGQFVHLWTLSEDDDQWRREHERRARERAKLVPGQEITGLVEAYWALRGIALFVEFASRLAARLGIDETFNLDIRLVGVAGRLLYSSDFQLPPRFSPFIASDNELRFEKCDIPVATLIAQARSIALEAATWFYHRFGWLEAPQDLLAREMDEMLPR